MWLIKGLEAGGSERLLLSFAETGASSSARFEACHILGSACALVPKLVDAGVPVHSLGARSSLDLRWLYRLWRLLRSVDVDILHVHSPYAAVGARFVVRLLRKIDRPVLVTTDHLEVDRIRFATRVAYRLTYSMDQLHLAVSEAVRRSVPGSARCASQVVYQGVDRHAIAELATQRTTVRSELDLTSDVIAVGTIANFREQKGYPDLVAAARLASTPRLSTIHFVLVGDGPLKSNVERLVSDSGLERRFSFLGSRLDVTRLLHAFDVFVLASRYEGLPIALLEAMAAGLPIVATAVGGVPEAVTDGREGLLVSPGDPAALADAIRAVAEDPKMRKKLAEAALMRSVDFDINRTVRETCQQYSKLLRRRSPTEIGRGI